MASTYTRAGAGRKGRETTGNRGLRARRRFGQAARVIPPELRALQQGNETAWDAAFAWLWPTAFAVAQLKLQPFLPDEIEDVAIEALEVLVEKVREVSVVEELKPLLAGITHHRAVSLLRERFAKKRGAGQTESLDAPAADGETKSDPPSDESPLDRLNQNELAGVLAELQRDLKPEFRAVLNDFFLAGLTYEQIANRRQMAVGTVGVYIKRGLEAIRKTGARHPEMLKELEAFLR